MPEPLLQTESTVADETMFEEQQDYIRSLERPPQPAMSIGGCAFPEANKDEDEDMDILEPGPESNLGFGERFSKEEEERLLSESNNYRLSGNRLFTSSFFLAALDAYTLALSHCPLYLTAEAAPIYNNLSAVHLKLHNYDEAVKTASKALEGRPGWSKARYRRAKGREGIGGWSNLQSAYDDYLAVLEEGGEGLCPWEKDNLKEKVRWMPRRIEEAKDRETQEMIGKLKDLGNGFLKPFGLSTDSFGMVKDPQSGGYSLSFNKEGR